MAKNLKIGERVTVERPIEFDPTSEPFEKGLPRIEAGHVGVVIGPAPQGRAMTVEFSGIEAIVSTQRLVLAADKPLGKKRGRKKQGDPTSTSPLQSKRERVNTTQRLTEDETPAQLITQIANTLLLNGGLKEDNDITIQIRFAELPEHVQIQIRALIHAKLALSDPALRK